MTLQPMTLSLHVFPHAARGGPLSVWNSTGTRQDIFQIISIDHQQQLAHAVRLPWWMTPGVTAGNLWRSLKQKLRKDTPPCSNS